MNMTKFANVLIGLLLLCAACKNSEEKETPNGFKFQVVKTGDGVKPKPGQLLIFEYIMKDSKDSVWQDTYENGFPGVFPIQDSSAIATEIGALQMFRMLSKADSVTLTRPAKEFFKDVLGGPMPPQVDSSRAITINIKVVDIIEQQHFAKFQADLYAKRKGFQKTKDAKAIEKYLADKKITAQTDTSGIRYVIHTTAGGAKPTPNSCVEVAYEGKFLKDEKTFDKNPKMSFSLNQVIPGWKQSIPMLGIGDSATFYIPSHLAYGPQGYPGAIPPNAILIFDVKLFATGENYDPQTRSCK
ncbi:FKBP-type peptidyl-prolyl cis-trans isomerase [Ohtaekwangia kribbensis]|jgi:FKBP-type peptidyl-prolyl cis-trans isomerase FkpA|uniref:Peptidyl-prolyl cis-trans isomerase n=1 Tax=Ohtaekwangia kribbensis TaxID=688913 RepID=A0ABW3K7J0_9BACT